MSVCIDHWKPDLLPLYQLGYCCSGCVWHNWRRCRQGSNQRPAT